MGGVCKGNLLAVLAGIYELFEFFGSRFRSKENVLVIRFPLTSSLPLDVKFCIH